MTARTNLITGDGDIDVEKSSVSGISLIFYCRFIFVQRFLFAHKSQLYVELCDFPSFRFLSEKYNIVVSEFYTTVWILWIKALHQQWDIG